MNTICSNFENDEEVIKSFPFSVYPNPTSSVNTFYLKWNSTHIHDLSISDQPFVPRTIVCLKRLRVLHIENTCLYRCTKQKLNSTEHFLPSSLTDLRISNTNANDLLGQIVKLKHLKILQLSNTNLISLPDTIGELSSLTQLYIQYSNLTSLPSTIKKLRSLQVIELTYNPNLHSIEQLNELPALEYLDTRNSPIDKLPRNLPKLHDLWMSNNNLTSLDYIQTLGNETERKKFFHFNDNFIQVVPPEISDVRNLFLLNLDNNQLKDLPRNLFYMSTLRKLYVDNNLISDNHLISSLKNRFNIVIQPKG